MCEAQALQVVFVFAVFAVKQREKYRVRGEEKRWFTTVGVINAWRTEIVRQRDRDRDREREKEKEG